MLDRTANAEEVERTVFQLGASKVLSPNGYNGVFFQTYWDVIVSTITTIVLYFFSTCSLPPSIYDADVVNVPKIVGPEDMSHFAP